MTTQGEFTVLVCASERLEGPIVLDTSSLSSGVAPAIARGFSFSASETYTDIPDAIVFTIIVSISSSIKCDSLSCCQIAACPTIVVIHGDSSAYLIQSTVQNVSISTEVTSVLGRIDKAIVIGVQRNSLNTTKLGIFKELG
jgi:hypothetical protein